MAGPLEPPQYRCPLSVLVVVHAAGGEVLLLRRVRPFDFWQSVTGSLQPGESHAQAAARELAEETGLGSDPAGALDFSGTERVFVIDPRWRHRYAPGTLENTEYEWRYRVPASCPIRINEREHSEYRWLAIDEAIETVWSWTNREALVALRDAWQ